ncbi:MAG TPA: helix-turn-helix transcriptional regulator [Steroidobacter sp.]|uniref:helix-turn-helix transcriptional regulator n=1 Tax=Steroidobacter sp. TaxID=1978227 RepID=UPI002ED91FEB
MRPAQVLVRAPSKLLQPFVKRFLVVEATAAQDDTHLPETGLVAAFQLRGQCLLNHDAPAPPASIAGLTEALRTHKHSAEHAVLIVSFTAVGAAAFLPQPLHEFSNATVDLHDALSGRAGVRRLHEQMQEADSATQRVNLVEEFLIGRVGNARPDALVAAAVDMIESTHATLRIGDLARKIGLSQSALERRFRAVVGTSPRKFSSLVRLQHVSRLVDSGMDLTTVAHASGYTDLSHFINDFKRFTGVAPGSYFSR